MTVVEGDQFLYTLETFLRRDEVLALLTVDLKVEHLVSVAVCVCVCVCVCVWGGRFEIIANDVIKRNRNYEPFSILIFNATQTNVIAYLVTPIQTRCC